MCQSACISDMGGPPQVAHQIELGLRLVFSIVPPPPPGANLGAGSIASGTSKSASHPPFGGSVGESEWDGIVGRASGGVGAAVPDRLAFAILYKSTIIQRRIGGP